MTYRELPPNPLAGTGVIRENDDGTETGVPNDENNADWRAYQDWLAAGNTPKPYVALGA